MNVPFECSVLGDDWLRSRNAVLNCQDGYVLAWNRKQCCKLSVMPLAHCRTADAHHDDEMIISALQAKRAIARGDHAFLVLLECDAGKTEQEGHGQNLAKDQISGKPLPRVSQQHWSQKCRQCFQSSKMSSQQKYHQVFQQTGVQSSSAAWICSVDITRSLYMPATSPRQLSGLLRASGEGQGVCMGQRRPAGLHGIEGSTRQSTIWLFLISHLLISPLMSSVMHLELALEQCSCRVVCPLHFRVGK